MTGPRVGDVHVVRRRISASMIRAFGELTADLAAHHVSPAVERPVAHGAYLLAALSMLGGRSALGHRITVELMAPAYAGDVVETRIEITDVQSGGQLGVLLNADFTLRNQHGDLLGRGTVGCSLPPDPVHRPEATVQGATVGD
ncbi:MaoC family dehydratase [Streptomyces sp. YC504]|uniref:MaoC family dehydratase n=1 Tax=Streptomyces mesophilus TaxID=1775132 RepID=A0A6G4X9C1_9ACTN|nr:MaoC family dehydratase [Streptomyces mesophilus]NGO74115.1 MaoC family dehydratase [Streptomyces mesophilus]